MVVDLVVPEESLRVRQYCSTAANAIAVGMIGKRTLSPSPQKKFLVRMFWYGYSGLSARGFSCSSCATCSQWASHLNLALTVATMMQGTATLFVPRQYTFSLSIDPIPPATGPNCTRNASVFLAVPALISYTQRLIGDSGKTH